MCDVVESLSWGPGLACVRVCITGYQDDRWHVDALRVNCDNLVRVVLDKLFRLASTMPLNDKYFDGYGVDKRWENPVEAQTKFPWLEFLAISLYKTGSTPICFLFPIL